MTNSKKYLLLWPMLFVIALGGFSLWLGTYLNSYVEGLEFSPDKFVYRRFQYYRSTFRGNPWGERQLSNQLSFADILVSDKWIVPVAANPPRWDLVSDNVTAPNSPDCDAQFLWNELEKRDEEFRYVWGTWTDDFPLRARIFWPLVADLARDSMYLYLPEIFHFVEQSRQMTDAEFDTELLALISRQYYQRALVDGPQRTRDQQIQDLRRAASYHLSDKVNRLLQLWEVQLESEETPERRQPESNQDPAPSGNRP